MQSLRASRNAVGMARATRPQPAHLAPASSRAARRRAGPVRSLDLDLDALEMPGIDGDLRSVLTELGAKFSPEGVVLTFGNPRQAVEAVESGVVLQDRSHWGRLRVVGEGRTALLHNQSTNSFTGLKAGQGCDTVFVTSTARTLDLATALVNEKSILVLTSAAMKQPLLERLNKFIFPADQVEIQDVSDRCSMFGLMGPEAEAVLKEIAGADVIKVFNAPYGSHQLIAFRNTPLIIVSGAGLDGPGYTLIADESVAGELFALLASKGSVLMGEEEWETARVLAGRPAPGAELTEDHNPLEAGLYHAVSLNKGCYIGQETLAKLSNKDGVKQQLWGLALDGPVAAGSVVEAIEPAAGSSGQADASGSTSSSTSSGVPMGRVTSVVKTFKGEHFGLAYLRCRSGSQRINLEGAKVKIAGGANATVIPIPFATRTFADELPAEVAGPGAEARRQQAEAERVAKEEAARAEAEAKAERLRAMQERLAAWQAQQAAAKGQQ